MHKIFTLFLLLISVISTAQEPNILFQNNVGGDDWDRASDILATSDGGYLLSGISESNASFDKSEDHFGNDDAWIVKLDAAGAIEWENTIGGDLREFIAGAQETPDGGFIVAGWTTSSESGDITEAILGSGDCWIFKLNSQGILVWQKLIGGEGSDGALSITKASNGNYLIGAISDSNISGEKTEDSYGDGDYWVFEIDNNGEIVWQKTVGGSLSDTLYMASETPDGGCILIGGSESDISGFKSENTIGSEGWSDYWAVKLDSNHEKVWDNTVGGDFVEAIRNGLVTSDGGCLLLGYSFSNASGDKSEDVIGGDQSYEDYWVVKLNADGELQWENTIGGDRQDHLWSGLELSDGSYIIGGDSNSDISGDKNEDSSFIDLWLLSLNESNGEIQWQSTIGGDNSEYMRSNMLLNPDNTVSLVAYSSSSVSGDITDGSNGGFDYWFAQLGDITLEIPDEGIDSSVKIFPNPGKNNITIDTNHQIIKSVSIFSSQGSLLYHQEGSKLSPELDITSLSSGIYFVKITSAEKNTTLKLIKE